MISMLESDINGSGNLKYSSEGKTNGSDYYFTIWNKMLQQ